MILINILFLFLFSFIRPHLPKRRTARKFDEFVEALPLKANGEFEKCIPFDKLTVDVAVYWLALVEYLHDNNDEEDALQDVICDLSTFCNYVAE